MNSTCTPSLPACPTGRVPSLLRSPAQCCSCTVRLWRKGGFGQEFWKNASWDPPKRFPRAVVVKGCLLD